MLGTTPRTLRQWESTGELIPSRKTKGGTRYYAVNDLLAARDENAPTIGYARVSGHRQQDDLKRQQEMLETYGAANTWKSLPFGFWPELSQGWPATPAGTDYAS